MSTFSAPAIFPAEIYPINGFDRESQLKTALVALRTLKTRHNRHVRWFAACDAHHALLQQWARDNGTDVSTAYQEAWKTNPELARPKGTCPSRTSGKKQYDDSAYLIRILGWDFTTNTRCHTMADLSNLVAAAEKVLKG